MKDKLLRIREVAVRLDVQESTVRKWVFLRKIGSVRINGRAVRIRESELRRLLVEVPAREAVDGQSLRAV
jgi:excisionase family DNA binding protein